MTEKKIIDENTGGAKGHKHCTIATIPSECMLEIGKCYANGQEKYGRGNFRKGYKWSLSADALQRHYWAWAGGEIMDDDETIKEPSHHLAAVVFHAIALMHFEMAEKGTDDIRRPEDLLHKFGDGIDMSEAERHAFNGMPRHLQKKWIRDRET